MTRHDNFNRLPCFNWHLVKSRFTNIFLKIFWDVEPTHATASHVLVDSDLASYNPQQGSNHVVFHPGTAITIHVGPDHATNDILQARSFPVTRRTMTHILPQKISYGRSCSDSQQPFLRQSVNTGYCRKRYGMVIYASSNRSHMDGRADFHQCLLDGCCCTLRFLILPLRIEPLGRLRGCYRRLCSSIVQKPCQHHCAWYALGQNSDIVLVAYL